MNGYHLQEKPENAAAKTPSSAPYVLQRCETLQGETDDNCGYVHSGMKPIVVDGHVFVTKKCHKMKMFDIKHSQHLYVPMIFSGDW